MSLNGDTFLLPHDRVRSHTSAVCGIPPSAHTYEKLGFESHIICLGYIGEARTYSVDTQGVCEIEEVRPHPIIPHRHDRFISSEIIPFVLPKFGSKIIFNNM